MSSFSTSVSKTMLLARLVSFLSKDMSLYPGDIIACGTNAGLGPMNEGDAIQVSVEGIGELTNKLS